MSQLSSSNDINEHEPNEVFDVVVKIKDASKSTKYQRTYINFLTSDGVYGNAYCRGLYDFRTYAGDHVTLENIKMDWHRGPKNELKYNLILTENSKATVICRNEMKANVKIYPPTGASLGDLRSVSSSNFEQKSNYAPSVSSKRQSASKNPATYGTLLEDFEITELEDEENKLTKLYKSVIRTNKGEEIPVAIDVKVKLPMILRKNYKISVFGGNVELGNVQGKMITNKNQIYFEGIEDDDQKKTQDSVSQQKQERKEEIYKQYQQQTINDIREDKFHPEVDNTKKSNHLTSLRINSTSQNIDREKFNELPRITSITPTTVSTSDSKMLNFVNSSMTCLRVEKLPPDVTEAQLLSKFTIDGRMPLVYIYRNFDNTQLPKDADINYEKHEDAKLALNFNLDWMNGKIIHVKWQN